MNLQGKHEKKVAPRVLTLSGFFKILRGAYSTALLITGRLAMDTIPLFCVSFLVPKGYGTAPATVPPAGQAV